MAVSDILKDRYIVIKDYPENKITPNVPFFPSPTEGSADLQKILKYPHLFRKLEWWEFREQDLTLMTSFDFAKVVIYVGYWRVDDIVPIHSYEIQQTRPAKLIGFYLGEHRQHLHAIDKVVPAALSEYKQWLIDNKRLDKRVYSEIK